MHNHSVAVALPLDHIPCPAHSCSPKDHIPPGRKLERELERNLKSLPQDWALFCFLGHGYYYLVLPDFLDFSLSLLWFPNSDSQLTCVSLGSCWKQMAIYFLIHLGFLAVRYLTCFWAQRSIASVPPAESSGFQAVICFGHHFQFSQHTSLECQEVNSHPTNQEPSSQLNFSFPV